MNGEFCMGCSIKDGIVGYAERRAEKAEEHNHKLMKILRSIRDWECHGETVEEGFDDLYSDDNFTFESVVSREA